MKTLTIYSISITWKGASTSIEVLRDGNLIIMRIPSLMPEPIKLNLTDASDLINAFNRLIAGE